MITAINKAAIEIAAKVLNTATRNDLNKYSHIVDISYNALKINQLYDDAAAFTASYKKFIELVAAATVGQTFRSYEDADFVINRGITYVDGGQWNSSKKYLIANSYSAVREFIRKISNKEAIKEDTYFGLVYRARTLDEYLGLGSTRDSLSLSGKTFNDQGQQTENGKVKYQKLSALDIGHTYKKNSDSRITPLSEKFKTLLDIKGLSGKVKLEITKSLKELSRVHLEGNLSFHNTIPDNFSKKINGTPGGFIVVTLHSFKKNKAFAKQESKLYSDIKKLIYKSYPAIAKQSGSNSFNQDIVEKVTLSILGNFAKNRVKPASHKKVSTKINVNSTAKVSVGETGMTLAKKKVADKPTTINKNITSNNLIKLQTLLSSQLQDVISANMGDGDQRSILNYRTGRFASTVKIENVSQARSGMITAFYSYMKNPYATFAEGGKQQYPISRNPKLLISRSIRDIGKALAINQMRAVSI